jgi:YbbR domain-containing protein
VTQETRQIWGLRLLSLAIAVALWLVISVEDRESRTQRAVTASVTYNSSPDLVLIEPVQEVRVVLSGPASQIAALDPRQVSVRVDLGETEPGRHALSLGAGGVSLPPNLRVESINPNQITIEVDRRADKQLRVEPVFTGEPAAGAVLGQVTMVPAEVVVEGPASRLGRLDHVETQPIDLDGHALSFEETVAVVSPDPLVQIQQPARVKVRVPLKISQPAGPMP